MKNRIPKKYKNDILLGIGLLMVALCLTLFTKINFGSDKNLVVKIYVDNEMFYSDSILVNNTVTVKNNVVTIKNGKVYMSEADCPDKLCINQGKISKSGQTIICLPNKIMVTIKGEKTEYDAVVK